MSDPCVIEDFIDDHEEKTGLVKNWCDKAHAMFASFAVTGILEQVLRGGKLKKVTTDALVAAADLWSGLCDLQADVALFSACSDRRVLV